METPPKKRKFTVRDFLFHLVFWAPLVFIGWLYLEDRRGRLLALNTSFPTHYAAILEENISKKWRPSSQFLQTHKKYHCNPWSDRRFEIGCRYVLARPVLKPCWAILYGRTCVSIRVPLIFRDNSKFWAYLEKALQNPCKIFHDLEVLLHRDGTFDRLNLSACKRRFHNLNVYVEVFDTTKPGKTCTKPVILTRPDVLTDGVKQIKCKPIDNSVEHFFYSRRSKKFSKIASWR